jgi:3-isopropylmalate/(R)-2-methylmalate dehydratase small subunit
MEPFKPINSGMMPLPVENVDTDQIIPARYLKVTDKSSLADGLFADWRESSDFVLNDERYKDVQVLVAGDNFGCGSSREHAPWSLKAYGFRAIISTSFADIFRNNSLKNGLLPIVVDEDTHQRLMSTADTDPTAAVQVDLAVQTVTLPDGEQIGFEIDPFARECILAGVDELGYLLQRTEMIDAYEAEHPPRFDTTELLADH